MTTIPPRPRRALRPRSLPTSALALALWASLVLAPVGGAVGSPAASVAAQPPSATETTEVSVLLDEVDPVVLVPGEPVTLTGRLLNHGSVPRRLTSLTATLSPTSLTSREQVDRWLDGDLPRGPELVLGDDTVGPVVPASGAVPFQVEVPGSVTDDLPDTAGVLPLVIGATEDDDDTAGTPAGAELRSTLSSAGRDDIENPLETAWVVPLTLPADPGLFSPVDDEHAEAWTAAIGPGSTLTEWLQGLDVPDATYVVDPATVLAPQPAPGISTPREGTVEQTPTPTPQPPATATPTPGDATGTEETTTPDQTVPVPVPDDGSATTSPEQTAPAEPSGADAEDVRAAAATLATTLAGLPDDQLWWLPRHDPDLDLVRRRQPPVDVVADLFAPSASPADPLVLGTGRHDVAWPVEGDPDPGEMAQMTALVRGVDADLRVVVLPRESLTADSAALPRRGAAPLERPGDLVALGADSWTSALVGQGAQEAEERGAGAAAQHLLAHTLGTHLEDPSEVRELVIAPPRLTPASAEVLEQLSDGWRAAPWLRSVSAQDLLDRAEGTQQVRLTGEGPQEAVLGDLVQQLRAPASPVDAERAEVLAVSAEQLDDLAVVLADTTALDSWRPVLDTLWSGVWRGHEEGWLQTRTVVRDDIQSTRDGVWVTPSSVNFLTNQGDIGITVVNDLGVAVEGVALELVATNGRLQVIEQPDPVDIGPDSRATASVAARSITRGETTLIAQLSTPDGTTLGEPVAIEVRVQPTGIWVYWVLGGVAGLVLVLGLARALRSTPPGPTAGAGPAPEGAP
ncbi:hypothetical protein AVL62_14245 [Serinicoccus chungangensis]|uniref:Uncharacterized protein n=1 Tax=Serinicoccus chungangensis TaxID=767452 RepID=A0A0W8I3P6_9MICO|nr:DUF6049 family protein [Serinicoccus chungangensis]KUG52482.1 hypothetical protein AVL62_14245 [Serinicoccus chungangensis]